MILHPDDIGKVTCRAYTGERYMVVMGHSLLQGRMILTESLNHFRDLALRHVDGMSGDTMGFRPARIRFGAPSPDLLVRIRAAWEQMIEDEIFDFVQARANSYVCRVSSDVPGFESTPDRPTERGVYLVLDDRVLRWARPENFWEWFRPRLPETMLKNIQLPPAFVSETLAEGPSTHCLISRHWDLAYNLGEKMLLSPRRDHTARALAQHSPQFFFEILEPLDELALEIEARAQAMKERHLARLKEMEAEVRTSQEGHNVQAREILVDFFGS